MNSKLMILTVATALAAVAILSLDAEAYNRFSGSNNCNQCHTNFEGFGEATHDFHVNTMGFSCGQCHAAPGDNPLVEKCAVCHISNPLWNTHLTGAPNDLNGFTCASCHDVTGNEVWDWSSLKHTFK